MNGIVLNYKEHIIISRKGAKEHLFQCPPVPERDPLLGQGSLRLLAKDVTTTAMMLTA